MRATPCQVWFDDRCGFCLRWVRWFRRLDWFGALMLRPISAFRPDEAKPGMSRESLEEAMHCVLPDGRVFRGARAFRVVAFRLPMLVPLGLVLCIPGAMRVAEPVYRWVSRHRRRGQCGSG